MVWAMENRHAGMVEADEIDHAGILEIGRPYLGDVVDMYSDWTPLWKRDMLFPEEADTGCPWQFRNFRERRMKGSALPAKRCPRLPVCLNLIKP
jgi:homospermidine synthase